MKTFDERKHVGRVFGHEEDVLLGRCLVDDIDRFLQREETSGDTSGRCHVHEVLTHLVARNVVVGDKNQIRAQGGIPLSCHLTMNQSVINTRKENIGLCHV